MDYHETIQYIYNLQKFGIKLGLQRVENLLNLFNNPHKSFRCLHVAGTNAKGSVCAILHSILKEASLKTGLYTSPHLINFTERIRIDDDEISEQDIIGYANLLVSVISKNDIQGITFFEFVTTLAFKYFKDKGVECVVVETGMGGRLDATNVVTPDVCVITPISFDHKEYLGDSIEKIAYEKAGIIKPQIPVVVSSQRSEALTVITERARETSSPVFLYGRDFNCIVRQSHPTHIVFDFYGDTDIEGLVLPLAGRHQAVNAATAIKSAYLYLKKINIQDDIEDIIRRGLKKTTWKGRLQWISDDTEILLDGAHNLESAKILKDFIFEHLSGRYKIFIVGIMDDKEKSGIIRELLSVADMFIFTSVSYQRAAKPEILADISRGLGYYDVSITQNVKDALNMARELSKNHDLKTSSQKPVIVITGSLYLIGEALEVLCPNRNKNELNCLKYSR